MNESAWPLIQGWIKEASNSVEVLPADETHREQALRDTGVTERSPMGALVYHTGGLLVDHGWLRFLGSGNAKLPRSMAAWNRGRSAAEHGKSSGFWLIADDVVGGFFALNGGAFDGATGKVFYFAPDTLHWEPLSDMGYSEFLVWSFTANLGRFYESMRWPGWESEVSALSADKAFSFYPFLFTKEGKDIAKCSRKACAVHEIFSLNVVELPRQLTSGGET